MLLQGMLRYLHLFSFVCMYGTYAGIQIAWMDPHFSEANFSSKEKFRKRWIFLCGRVIKESFSWLFFRFGKEEREGRRYQSFCGTTTTILGQEEEEEEEDMVSSSLLPPNPPPLTHLRKSWERRKSPTEIDKWRVFPFQIHRAVCWLHFLFCIVEISPFGVGNGGEW